MKRDIAKLLNGYRFVARTKKRLRADIEQHVRGVMGAEFCRLMSEEAAKQAATVPDDMLVEEYNRGFLRAVDQLLQLLGYTEQIIDVERPNWRVVTVDGKRATPDETGRLRFEGVE